MGLREWANRNSIPIMAVFLFGVWAFGYFAIGHQVDPSRGVSLGTPADSDIPYVKLALFPYLALYALFLMPFFLVRDKEFFRVFTWAYVTVMVFCYLIFWNFPVTLHHPSIEVTDLTTWGLSILYSADPPVNCFPSMHAAMAMMAALTILEISLPKGIFAMAATLGIGAAALLIKQHYIADILGGFGISAITYYVYFKQRIHETLTRDLRRGYAAVDQYIDVAIEKRLEAIIDRRVEAKLRELAARPPEVKPPDEPPTST